MMLAKAFSPSLIMGLGLFAMGESYAGEAKANPAPKDSSALKFDSTIAKPAKAAKADTAVAKTDTSVAKTDTAATDTTASEKRLYEYIAYPILQLVTLPIEWVLV